MALITLNDASLAFGHVALLDHAAMSLESGERLGLIGRNGSVAKALRTLLKVLSARDGEIVTLEIV